MKKSKDLKQQHPKANPQTYKSKRKIKKFSNSIFDGWVELWNIYWVLCITFAIEFSSSHRIFSCILFLVALIFILIEIYTKLKAKYPTGAKYIAFASGIIYLIFILILFTD